MKQITVSDLFGGYCYGPADLEDIVLGDGYVRLRLRDSSGHTLSAVYRGCAYWSITPDTIGRHFSLVQEVRAEIITAAEYSHVLRGLEKAGSPTELLQKWEAGGYRFYLHSTGERDVDYLVVAKGVRIDA